MTTDILSNIKASAAGKSAPELLTMRREIAAFIAGLEPYVTAEKNGVGEVTRRFGQDGGSGHPQSARQQAARLERHRAELEYLDQLLQFLDPVLAAQAAAQ